MQQPHPNVTAHAATASRNGRAITIVNSTPKFQGQFGIYEGVVIGLRAITISNPTVRWRQRLRLASSSSSGGCSGGWIALAGGKAGDAAKAKGDGPGMRSGTV